MKSNNLVSLIIPTYNREKLLKRAVNSALSQSYKNIEIIIADNYSVDKTKKYCEKLIYENKINNIRYIRREKNIGPNLNFYFAIREARGDYIAFLADDDYIEPDYIEKLMAEMINSIAVHVCSFACERMPNGEIIREEKYQFLGERSDYEIIKSVYDFRINKKLALLYYGLTKKEILIEVFPEPEFSVSKGKKSVSGLEVPYIGKIISKGQIKIVPLLLFNYTGSGTRDGEQSLAFNDSLALNKFDYLIILNGQLLRLFKTSFDISSNRINKSILLRLLIFSYSCEIAKKIVNEIKKKLNIIREKMR